MYLLQVGLDEGDDEPTVHERQSVVDEESQADVESASVVHVLDVFLCDLVGHHAHQTLQVLHELDGEPVFPLSVEHRLAGQELTHAFYLRQREREMEARERDGGKEREMEARERGKRERWRQEREAGRACKSQ